MEKSFLHPLHWYDVMFFVLSSLISIVREEKFAPEKVPFRTLYGSENSQSTTADRKTNDYLEIRERTQEKKFCKITCHHFFAQVV